MAYTPHLPIKGWHVHRKRANPKYYNGTAVTSHKLRELLPKTLRHIGAQVRQRSDLVLATWPEVVGPKIAAMTRAHKFHEGVLEVRVSNSTLLSLLIQTDKKRIIASLRRRLPEASIRDVYFRIG